MLTVNKPNQVPLIKFYVGTGGVKKGQIAKVNTNTAVVGTEGITTAIVIGIACDDYDATDVGLFYDLHDCEIECDVYQGGGTDTFADANIGVAYDFYTAGTTAEFFIDANDTTNPMAFLQSYDNAVAKATVRMNPALLYM